MSDLDKLKEEASKMAEHPSYFDESAYVVQMSLVWMLIGRAAVLDL